MALTPDQVAQLKAWMQANPSGGVFGDWHIQAQGGPNDGYWKSSEGGQEWVPQPSNPTWLITPNSSWTQGVFNPSQGQVAYEFDPTTGGLKDVPLAQQQGFFSGLGDSLKSAWDDNKDGLALFAALATMGMGAGALAGTGAMGTGAAGAAGAAEGAGGFGAGVADAAGGGLSGVGAAQGAGGGLLSNFATGFTDTGTAGGALDAGYAGSGAVTGASGLAFPSVAGSSTVPGSSGFSLSSLLNNPLSTAGLLNAGGSLIGALAANKAANTQAQAGQNALNLQRDIFNTQVGLQAPFRQGGIDSLAKLSYLLGVGQDNSALASSAGGYGSMLKPFGMEDFQLDPGIQFQIQQGNQALTNSQAAKNGTLTGAAMKALMDFNQQMAGTGYQSAYDRYMQNKQFQLNSLLAPIQVGQAAASGTAANAGSMANAMSDTITGIGNANASGTVGIGNSLANGLGSLGSTYLLSQLLGKSSPNMTSAPPSYA
jgi:hypothetical protein